ncbi:MAG: Ig-like domain-containing protein [Trueperaceae bacterium]|nr:Ig-like domain-containing protein [Trueperaceae bacterium]
MRSLERPTTGTNPGRGRELGRYLTSILLIAATIWLAACGGETVTPSVVKVEIDQADQTISVGQTVQLSAKVTVLGGASQAVTWASSLEGVASVSATGLVTGQATGTAVITATSVGSPKRTSSIEVTVVDEPAITTFTAAPASIVSGGSTTLAWVVTGDYDDIAVLAGTTVEAEGLAATGNRVVTPTATTEYTLRVTHPLGDPVTATATVTVTSQPANPTITAFDGSVTTGSMAQLTWTVAGADTVELYAVSTADPTDAVLIDTYAGTSSGATVPLQASTHQAFRLVAKGVGPDDTADRAPLPNVVLNGLDSDPYNLRGWVAEPVVPGSLRAVMEAAASGSVIGFAADVDEIDAFGVDIIDIGGSALDSHLIARRDVTISGRSGDPVTLKGRSAWQTDYPGDPFTYGSRVFYVPAGVTVTLENLVITGGSFIYTGAGIHNAGTLTVRNSTITGNRAFGTGGGIRNLEGATLTVENSSITGNRAETLDAEIDFPWDIRGSGGDPAQFPGINGWGGGLANYGTATVTNTVIDDNFARQGAGGIYNIGTLTLQATDVTGNTADHVTGYMESAPSDYSEGGGVANYATLTFTGGEVSGNTTADQGGGLYHGNNAISTLTDVSVINNVAGVAGTTGYGGGIMHHYYTGEMGNLDRTGGTLTGNIPENLLSSDDGIRPLGLAPGTANLDALPAGVMPEGHKFR